MPLPQTEKNIAENMVLNTSDATVEPQGREAIDQVALGRYLTLYLPGLDPNSIDCKKFSHGQSNPTYFVKTNIGAYVLRKKPPPPTLPSAHAIEREYEVLRALGPTAVPTPRAVLLCDDASILGTPFYVMDHVAGQIFDDPALPGLAPSHRSAVYAAMAATLAALHSVAPAAVGLQSYGPAAQYNARQVRRWGRQFLSSVTAGEAPMAEMVALGEALGRRIPATDGDPAVTRISHGDYRLDNLVFDAEAHGANVVAVLDWELSTLGDPLADLAYSCLPYHLGFLRQAGFPSGFPALPGALPPGVPTEQQYIEQYCMARGMPYPLTADWPFYLALGLFRLASILAGVGARAKQGNASSRIAALVGADTVVRSLASAALELLNKQPVAAASSSAAAAVPRGLEPSDRVQPILAKLKQFMADKVYPAEAVLNAHAASDARWSVHPAHEGLKVAAKVAGLWNLWIPAGMADSLQRVVEQHAVDSREAALLLGPRLSNLEYAHCAEMMGRSVWASEVFNCSAPDTGNMEVLARYGSAEQQRRWLLPLMRGEIRSCFAMTEPAVASSDATNIEASILRSPDGRHYAIDGVKWWISGATDPRCAVAIVMGKTDRTAPMHSQQSMVLVPMDAPGVTVVRPLPVFGFDDAPHGHAEVTFADVRVPAANLILGEGRGFEIAQGRLGPGRLHHCMRAIGMGERGLELLVSRAMQRTAFGRPLIGHQQVRVDVARSRVELDAARLTVLEAARALDDSGNKIARGKIAAAKVQAPNVVLAVLDRAIQVHGGAGVSDVTPLAAMWAGVRTLRLADGPDIVHLETIAKLEMAKARRAKL